jgi:uncharacterized protein
MTKSNPVSPPFLCELVYVPCGAEPLLFSSPWVEGLTIASLVQASGFLQQDAGIANLSVGIFAKCANWDTLLKPGDRVELYRPLMVDPKEKRRRQAKAKL